MFAFDGSSVSGRLGIQLMARIRRAESQPGLFADINNQILDLYENVSGNGQSSGSKPS